MAIYEILTDLTKFQGATPVSISRVNTLLACPLKWKLQYIDKIKQAPYADQVSTDVGKFLHAVAEHDMQKSKLSGNLSFVAENYDKTWESFATGYSDEVIERAAPMRDNSRGIAEYVYNLIDNFSFTPYTEVRYGMSLSGKILRNITWRNALWVGIMDLHMHSPRFSGSLIIDYKSHAAGGALSAREKLQAESYALLEFLRIPTLKLVQASIASFSTGLVTDIGVYKQKDVPELEKSFAEYLLRYKALLERKVYDAVSGDHCVWCGYAKTHCPLQ